MKVKLELESKQLEAKLKQVEGKLAGLGGGTGALKLQQGLKGAASEASHLMGILTGDRLSGATSQLTSLAGAVGGIPGPAGLAVGSIAALGAVTAGTVTAMYGLTKSAADYGSTIYDASVKTGLGAESISSLKIAADQSGTSLETVTSGIAKFDKALSKSKDGIKEFGITPKEALNDLDGSLAKVFKRIADAKPGYEQTTLAQKAFGKSGADLIPMIQSFNGDLPALIKHFKELGLTISDKDAAAADEFGDQMDTLNAQLAAVARTIGMELMPTFLEMSRDMSNWLAKNQSEIKYWAGAIKAAFDGVLYSWKMYIWLAKNASTLAHGGIVTDPLPTMGSSSTGKAMAAGGTPRSRSDGFDPDGVPIGNLKAHKPPKETDKAFRQFFEEMGFTVNRTFGGAVNTGSPHPYGGAADLSVKGKAIGEIFGMMVRSIEKGYRIVDESGSKPAPGIKRTGPNVHVENAKTTLAKGSIFTNEKFSPEQIAYLKNLDQQRLGKATGMGGFEDFNKKRVEDTRKAAEEELDIETRALDAWLRAEADALSDRNAIRGSEADYAEEELKRQLNKELISEEEYQSRIADLKIGTLQEERDELTEMIGTRENMLRIQQLDLEIATEKLKKENAITEALRKQNQEREEMLRGLKKANQRPGTMKKRGEAAGGFGSGIRDTIGGEKWATEADMIASSTQRMGQIAGQAINDLAGAMGSLVENWVLYGSATEGGAKKAVASALAMAASQSTVSAIMETAYGIAALTPWGAAIYGPAALHFKSAALFGLVAAGTALGGRALAGDSFKNDRGGGRASGGGSSSSSSTESTPDPYSRVSSNAYTSGRRRSEQLLYDQIERVFGHLTPMKPGDVLVHGMRQKPGAIIGQAAKEARQGRGGRELGRSLGLK